MSFQIQSLVRIAAAVVIVAAVPAVATACAPEPSASASASASPSGDAATPTSSPTPSNSNPTDDVALPESCEALYSAPMLATLQSDLPPLNDSEVDLYSTQIVPALEILDSGVPTLRCTWGGPGTLGLATNVSIVSAEQNATVVDALTSAGLTCSETAGGTLCSAQSEVVDLDGNTVARGESHFLRANGWVSTSWVGALPDGYTEDIATTLWP
ncbi:hypothetical protein FHX49_001590 [Microbacterium endophyticum]|uniref:DUF3515 domain-containing protein n=1 Tax=Microbacterium endophyticum TaxID=1526412 RepID=A0A7W4V372_9MICO|nr:hypothetical protein [Microbacterium endophyticum]MBB2976020.1 hypothetical protein [Microbacterium endophyticum]NIK35061.1 hypothetical protein [Microbacterium endophyticum]